MFRPHHKGDLSMGDKDGCFLPDGHFSAHAFRADNGDVWRWEYDKDCTCEDCMTDSWEDACRIFWKEEKRPRPRAKRVTALAQAKEEA
jgi:uncharacterized Fe-S center protein